MNIALFISREKIDGRVPDHVQALVVPELDARRGDALATSLDDKTHKHKYFQGIDLDTWDIRHVNGYQRLRALLLEDSDMRLALGEVLTHTGEACYRRGCDDTEKWLTKEFCASADHSS